MDVLNIAHNRPQSYLLYKQSQESFFQSKALTQSSDSQLPLAGLSFNSISKSRLHPFSLFNITTFWNSSATQLSNKICGGTVSISAPSLWPSN
jgi:hypothetical protein